MMLKNSDGSLYCMNKCEEKKDEVLCPKCGEGHLVSRVASRGKNKGNEFLSCSRFPRCRFVLNAKILTDKCPICGKTQYESSEGTFCFNKECKNYKEI
jgi:ssDNA-binding Zn-finger/Zn-ribbon topoisomerase 1